MKSTFRLLVAAAVQARNGNHQRAAVLLQEASKSNDIRKCIAAVGAMPTNASARRAVRASAWPFKVNAASQVDHELGNLDEYTDWNPDLKFDANDNGKLRDSQVGGFDDDLDLMGLDGDLGDDDLVMSAFGEDEGEEEEDAAAEDDEENEEEDEEDEGKPKDKAEARRIHAALANLSVLAAKAKKKKAKKK